MSAAPTRPDPNEAARDALRRGSPDALGNWFPAEHRIVYRLCLGFLADGGLAEDVSEDAMVRLHDSLAAFDPGRDWNAWRVAVVMNLCRDTLRKRATRRRIEAAASVQRATSVTSPETEAGRGEIRAALVELLRRVPEREREAFVLCDLEGVDTDAAAVMLDVGASTVRSLLSLARRRLRELFRPRLAGLLGATFREDRDG